MMQSSSLPAVVAALPKLSSNVSSSSSLGEFSRNKPRRAIFLCGNDVGVLGCVVLTASIVRSASSKTNLRLVDGGL